MSNLNTMTTPEAATLTASELFGRLLDAPARSEARSSLIPQRIEPWSLQDELIGCFQAECLLDVVSHDMIVGAIRASADPDEEMSGVIFDLECFVDGLRALQREFRALADHTLVAPTETGSTHDQEQLQQARRYACPGPVIDTQDAA